MTVTHLKSALKTPASGDAETAKIVSALLQEIESGGEAATRAVAERLDGWTDEIVVSEDALRQAQAGLPESVKEDIRFARERIGDFAARQRDSMQEFEVSLVDGLIAGQRLIPVTTAGCYVPGGRYAHAASAIMSVCTAKVAGVENVVATSPAQKGRGIHPAILYAMKVSGADHILALGGVQGVAALAYGHFTGHPADIIVGPGNRFVAEAKR
ncbi:MAG: histidinol dehydrogenase, partial [Kiloniellales bacterium]|nr:histidinol dehydrogenase [Kiloniellales bacterium]